MPSRARPLPTCSKSRHSKGELFPHVLVRATGGAHSVTPAGTRKRAQLTL